MTTSEKLNALLALHAKDRKNEYPWMTHPWVSKAMDSLRYGILFLNYKHTLIYLNLVHKFDLKEPYIWNQI